MFLPHPRGFRDPSLVAERLAMLETDQSVQPLRVVMVDGAAVVAVAVMEPLCAVSAKLTYHPVVHRKANCQQY